MDQLLAGTPQNLTSIGTLRLMGGSSKLGHLAKVPVYIHTSEFLFSQDRSSERCKGPVESAQGSWVASADLIMGRSTRRQSDYLDKSLPQHNTQHEHDPPHSLSLEEEMYSCHHTILRKISSTDHDGGKWRKEGIEVR